MNANPKNTAAERLYYNFYTNGREIFFYCILKETEFDMRNPESPIYANEVINIQYDACLILSPQATCGEKDLLPAVTICPPNIPNEIVLTFIPSKSSWDIASKYKAGTRAIANKEEVQLTEKTNCIDKNYYIDF